MAPAAKPAVPRKRNRKRKRRAASSSESSSESSSASDVESPINSIKPAPSKIPVEESSSESSSESSDSDTEPIQKVQPSVSLNAVKDQPILKRPPRHFSPSPSPPPAELPSFLPSAGNTTDDVTKDRLMKEKFRKFWMNSVADGFKDDLEEIRKETNLGTARLSMLIDSLASGADVFTRSSQGDTEINEVEMVLN